MDLSSLEGPPIQDSRFTTTRSSSWGREVPQIRLEGVQSPIDTNRDLPPRPASTDAIPPRNKYPSTGSNGFWHGYGSNQNEDRSRPSNAFSGLGISRDASNLSAPEPRNPRPHSHTVSSSSPHQLVWLDSEQIWILTTTSTTPTSYPQSRSSLAPSHATGPNGRSRGHLAHSRSMEMYPTTDMSQDMESYDMPPPYERHIYDRPLPPLPGAATRVQPPNVPPAPAPTTSNFGSRWAAVGQRIHRTPPL